MEAIDFVEKQAIANGTARLDALETLNKRAHTLATLLLGGAGAMGTFALGQWPKVDGPLTAVPLLGASVWCFLVAGWVVVRCMQTRALYPLHNEPATLQALLLEVRSVVEFRGNDDAILLEARWREVGRVGGAIRSIDEANAAVARALNWAYRGAVVTPLAALVGWVGYRYLL